MILPGIAPTLIISPGSTSFSDIQDHRPLPISDLEINPTVMPELSR